MEWEEFQIIRKWFEEKSLALMKHEGRESATIGVLVDNYTQYTIDGRIFYSVKSNVFKHLIERFYLAAHKNFPDKFGTGNASDVIEALYKIQPVFDLKRYTEFLKYEQFSYLIEFSEGKVSDKVLRLDLFRKLNTNTKGHLEFTGGIMHVLKHFSIKGINLSTGRDIHDIIRVGDVIDLIVRAFFIEKGKFETPKKFVSRINLDEKYCLKFVFYLEEKTNVFFVKTIFKELR